MTINELPDKPVWQMTGEELLFLAQLFLCSLTKANSIKQIGKINSVITQVGRKIPVDADLALELAGRKTGGRG